MADQMVSRRINSMDHNIVWEFRPLPNFYEEGFKRYADGLWIPDDGEYDIAFIGTRLLESSLSPGHFDGGWPYSLYVRPGRKNIYCSWTTNGWWVKEPRHEGGNAWHYALKTGTTDWGSYDDNSVNHKAGDEAQHKLCSLKGCANGHPIEFHWDDKHIHAGLLRNRETKEVFTWPHYLKCMYCGETPWKNDYSIG